MTYFLVKTFVTALIVAAVSEISQRYPLWASLLVSLPLTSILAFVWIYADSKDNTRIIQMSYDIFWLVLPSLAFFLALPFLMRQGLTFPLSMGISMIAMGTLYAGGVWILKAIG